MLLTRGCHINQTKCYCTWVQCLVASGFGSLLWLECSLSPVSVIPVQSARQVECKKSQGKESENFQNRISTYLHVLGANMNSQVNIQLLLNYLQYSCRRRRLRYIPRLSKPPIGTMKVATKISNDVSRSKKLFWQG